MAGLYGALAVQGKPVKAIHDQRILVLGAGSAGMGVSQMIVAGMVKQVQCALCTASSQGMRLANAQIDITVAIRVKPLT